MKKAILAGAAVAALALPGSALAGNEGDGSGYHPNANASFCGQAHGAFGILGKDYNYAGGADGQATGANNSAKYCHE
jgi:hypothetical protein